MDKRYVDIMKRIVLTDHGYDNKEWRRKDIPIWTLAVVLADGEAGFSGHRRFKRTHYSLGIEVVYKLDKTDPENPLYVIITYYRVPKRRRMNVVDKALNNYNKFAKLS